MPENMNGAITEQLPGKLSATEELPKGIGVGSIPENVDGARPPQWSGERHTVKVCQGGIRLKSTHLTQIKAPAAFAKVPRM